MDRLHFLIRRARPDEAECLSELALRSKAHWGYDAAFLEACRAELTVEVEAIASNATFVLQNGGSVLGFCMLEPIDRERMELAHLFVEPACIGRGCGRALLDHAKTHARALGCSGLVIQSDPHAVAFYEAAGGRKIGIRASGSQAGRALPVLEIELGR